MDDSFYFDNRWRLIKQARMIPDLIGASKRNIDLTIGENDFGISSEGYDRKLTGSAIDITGYTIKVRCMSLPEKPSLVEEVQGYDWNYSYTLFTNTCTHLVAANGTCRLSISRNDSDFIGQVLCQILVENPSGDKKVLGSFMFSFLQNLFDVSE